jgi:DNA modification methylase
MTVRILLGDCRERLTELPDESVNCCVTSPPYFGLRDEYADIAERRLNADSPLFASVAAA